MKIIHLSDTHVGHGDGGARFERVIADILALPEPERHVVVHTGDLIDRATPVQRQAGRELLDRLRDGGFRVLLSPGNHDYGDAARVIREGARAFREDLAPYLFGDQPAAFPVLTRIGGLAFVGLDSSEAELGFFQGLFAEGQIGATQLERLNGLLDRLAGETPRPRIVVYLHHHPFINGYAVQPDTGDGHLLGHLVTSATRSFRRLKDAWSLLQCLRDRVDLVLFGHQHFGLDHRAEASRYGIPLAFDASSTTCANTRADRMRYRIIDSATGCVEIRMVSL